MKLCAIETKELEDKVLTRFAENQNDELLEDLSDYVINSQKEIERLQEDIGNYVNIVLHERKEIDRLQFIIKEVREILKYHLSNPSGTKNGWHIDIWNSEDINKLNENLRILDKENK